MVNALGDQKKYVAQKSSNFKQVHVEPKILSF